MQYTSITKHVLVAALFGLMAGAAHAAVDATAAESFKKMDTDGDGFLSVGEAMNGLISGEAFIEADKNKDGKLDSEEYAAAGQGNSKAKVH